MKSITHTKAFTMDFPIARLFPLFSPEGEKKWVPGWDYENVMGTTELCEDYVFTTRTHDHGTADAVWIVKRYEPASHFVQFYKIEPQSKVGIVTVKCTELDVSRTKIQVTYHYRALSPQGETFVAGFDTNAYDEFMDEWKRLLKEYFETAF